MATQFDQLLQQAGNDPSLLQGYAAGDLPPNNSPSHEDVLSALLAHPATKQTAQAIVDNNHVPQTPEELQAYNFIGQILGGTAAANSAGDAVNNSQPWFAPGELQGSADYNGIPSDAVVRLPQPDAAPAQYPTTPQPGFLSQVGGGLSSALQSLTAPGNNNGVPTPSVFNTLAGLGIGLATGGGIAGASGINTLQHAQALSDAGIVGQMQRNQLALDAASPAGQLRKQQQQFYASRMASDVNRYIKMISDDVNHNISDDERENIWQRDLVQKYAPLGLHPGASPNMVEQWNQESASPEFRNAKTVENYRSKYGDLEAGNVGEMLRNGAKPKEIADYQIGLEKIKLENKKIEYEARTKDFEETQKRIEEFRKRDLEMYKEAGITGTNLTMPKDSKLLTATPAYLSGQAKINAFYDSQHQSLREGKSVNATQMGFNVPADLNSNTFGNFANGLGVKANPEPPFIEYVSANIDPANFQPNATQKSRAVDLDAHPEQTEFVAQGVRSGNGAAIVKLNGQIQLFKPKKPM